MSGKMVGKKFAICLTELEGKMQAKGKIQTADQG